MTSNCQLSLNLNLKEQLHLRTPVSYAHSYEITSYPWTVP